MTFDGMCQTGPGEPRFTVAAVKRFWANVEMVDGCWLWTGPLDEHGYAQCGQRRGHTFAFTLLRGLVPAGHHLDHTCHDAGVCRLGDACPHRRCVNPDHLEPVTAAENNRRWRRQRATSEVVS